MANNCFITKLRGVVSNENLPTLQSLQLKVVSNEQQKNDYFNRIKVENAILLKKVGSGVTILDSSDNEYTSITNPAFTSYFALGNGTIEVRNKNSITQLVLSRDINFSDDAKTEFKCMSSLTQYIHLYCTMDIDLTNCNEVLSTSLIYLRITGGNNFICSVQELSTAFPSLSSIDFSGMPNLTGNLSDFTNLSALHTLYLSDASENLTTKTIESFVQSFRSKGKTSFQKFNINGDYLTFNGTAIGNGNHRLDWTSSTITLDGTTINA